MLALQVSLDYIVPAEPTTAAVLQPKIYVVTVFVSNNETLMDSLAFVTQGGPLMGFIQLVMLMLMNVLVGVSFILVVIRGSSVLICRVVTFVDHVLLGIPEMGIIVRILMNVQLIMEVVVLCRKLLVLIQWDQGFVQRVLLGIKAMGLFVYKLQVLARKIMEVAHHMLHVTPIHVSTIRWWTRWSHENFECFRTWTSL